MNKNLTINMGNCNRRKYIPILIDLVRSGEVEPMGILTQHEALGSAIDAYKAFDERQEGGSRSHPNLREFTRADGKPLGLRLAELRTGQHGSKVLRPQSGPLSPRPSVQQSERLAQ
jgi:hypothetical protein